MNRSRQAVLATVIVAVVYSPVIAAGQPPAYTADPPAAIRAELDKLRRGEDQTAAVVALAARDDAAPYIRMELSTAVDRACRRDLAEALRDIEARTHERNKVRFRRWATARRFDLCNEVLVGCPDKQDAAALVKLVTPVLHEIGLDATERLHARDVLIRPKDIDRAREVYQVAEEVVSIRRPLGMTRYLIRCDKCRLEPLLMFGWFVACRSEVRYVDTTDGDPHEWLQCTVLVNNEMSIRTAEASVFICDGDVELEKSGVQHRRQCIVVANGDIRTQGGYWIDESILCATGNIGVPAHASRLPGNLYFAGGSVTIGGKPAKPALVKEHQKQLPFGIRFLDPKDFGLELAAQNGGVQVMGIEPWSPFARYGVEDADVIRVIDGVDATDISTFRRALRRGVIRESVVLRIRRGDKDLTRIVFLDGIPVPTTPPPREATPR